MLQSKDAIASAPGYPTEARTVKSYSKTGFHLVVPGRNGKYTCDCPNFQSLSICSHSVSVPELNKKLPDFIQWFRKLKKLPSLTPLTMGNVSKGCGRKGGRPPRKKKAIKTATKRVELNPIPIHSTTGNTTPVRSTTPLTVTDFTQDTDFANQSSSHDSTSPTISSCMPSAFPVYPSPFQTSSNPIQMSPFFPQPFPVYQSINSPWCNATYTSQGDQTVHQLFSTPHSQSISNPQQPFNLKFVEGNISICFGCKNRYP